MGIRRTLLVLIPLQEAFVQSLAEWLEVEYAPEGPSEALWARLQGRPVDAVLTNGSTGLSREQMQGLPGLGLVCSFGAGYEAIDLAAAQALGMAVSHAPGVNNATVADHALALMLGLARGLVPLDRAVKEGRWLSSRAERPTLNHQRLGLLGLGHIGQQIARRAAAFDMQVAYHTRQPREGVPYAHHASVLSLAEASDFLVVACPGGAATRHLVNREVLRSLGSQGFLINIARGSVVHTGDLVAALQQGEIAGAGLDVLEGEPEVPQALRVMEQVLLTPHVSGRSPEAQRAQLACLEANLRAFWAGQPLPNPVPR
jgi:lactate dehydrogenase-like 2-hydroxyacid dehydrogenase